MENTGNSKPYFGLICFIYHNGIGANLYVNLELLCILFHKSVCVQSSIYKFRCYFLFIIAEVDS